ncbi:TBC1 domain family member 5 [Colletotrichum sp. SAR 10_77]|nr:TBC1 domain family member 5 [Colletotrichum sp. SAR 10_77]
MGRDVEAFLLFQTAEVAEWAQHISESRDYYSRQRDHFLKFIKHPEELAKVAVDPLTDDPKSPWNTVRQDEIIRAEIAQDVRRLPDEPFYHEERIQTMIIDALFVYCKLHPNSGGYRQGMHELFAPIACVVNQDTLDRESLSSSGATADETMLTVLDSSYIEHDTFAMFSKIMEKAKAFYEVKNSISRAALASASKDRAETSAIVEKSKYIHEVCLAKVDPELANHLKDIEILPQIFLIRWIRLLFGREFPFDQCLVLWDTMFAVDPSLNLIDLICVAMLIRIRWSCRFIQQQGGVEALFQGAAKNMLERSEKLGINQAVRDAMGEIKRNMQGLNDVRYSPRVARQLLNDETAAQAVAALERRNRLLANMLDETVSSLRSLATSDLDNKVKTLELVEVAAAKVQFVKVYLEDSTIEVPDLESIASPTSEDTKEEVPMDIGPDDSAVLGGMPATENVANGISTLSLQEDRETKSSDKQPILPDAMEITEDSLPTQPSEAPSVSASSPASGTPSPKVQRPQPPIPTRSTLAQSSFSWMLEPDQSAHSATPPQLPKATSGGNHKKRPSQNISRERNAFLFGEVVAESEDQSKPVKSDDIFGLQPMGKSKSPFA